jgi:hypothetical protein
MTDFQAYATAFELYPKEGEAFQYLLPILSRIERVDFTLRVNDPSVNQGQMTSDFDEELKKMLQTLGAEPWNLAFPHPQEFDFAFMLVDRRVVVEIEKTNREKILRDILKCHMYQHFGADFTIIGLPKNYAHTHGIWNLFEFGVNRFSECKTYGFGTPDKLGRILLWGYEQYDASTKELLSKQTRQLWRKRAAEGIKAR